MNTCLEIEEHLEEYRYHLLGAAQMLQVEAHLSSCALCGARVERIRSIEESLVHLGQSETVPEAIVQSGARRIAARGIGRFLRREAIPMAAAAVFFAVVLAWLMSPSSPPHLAGPQESKGTFEEKKLGVLENGRPQDVVFSPDGKSWAYPSQVGEEGKSMVIAGERGEVYKNVGIPYYSPDGKQVAYTAQDLKTGQWLVVLGKARNEEFASTFGPQAPNSGQAMRVGAVLWAPDSHAAAYVGRSQSGELFVVTGDTKRGPYKSVSELAWSPEGRTLAFAAVAGTDSFVVVGDQRGEIFDRIDGLTYSPDGKTVAYLGWEGRKVRVVAGGKKWPGFEPTTDHPYGRPVFSPDGKSLAVSTGTGLMLNGSHVPGPGDDSADVTVGDPLFSPDGKRIAYPLKHLRGTWVVLDGKESTERFDGVKRLLFSPDGSVLAYVAAVGTKELVVVGDRIGEKFAQVSHLKFSPGGDRVAYRAERFGKQVIVAGDRISEDFEEVTDGPTFSPDGRRVAFVIRKGAEFWSKVLDVK